MVMFEAHIKPDMMTFDLTVFGKEIKLIIKYFHLCHNFVR